MQNFQIRERNLWKLMIVKYHDPSGCRQSKVKYISGWLAMSVAVVFFLLLLLTEGSYKTMYLISDSPTLFFVKDNGIPVTTFSQGIYCLDGVQIYRLIFFPKDINMKWTASAAIWTVSWFSMQTHTKCIFLLYNTTTKTNNHMHILTE